MPYGISSKKMKLSLSSACEPEAFAAPALNFCAHTAPIHPLRDSSYRAV